jgi:hypothetical protein
VRAEAAISGQVADVHGEHNGAIYQQVTLGRSDIAPVSLIAEDRTDVYPFLPVSFEFSGHAGRSGSDRGSPQGKPVPSR